jgi:hypothetical protein
LHPAVPPNPLSSPYSISPAIPPIFLLSPHSASSPPSPTSSPAHLSTSLSSRSQMLNEKPQYHTFNHAKYHSLPLLSTISPTFLSSPSSHSSAVKLSDSPTIKPSLAALLCSMETLVRTTVEALNSKLAYS